MRVQSKLLPGLWWVGLPARRRACHTRRVARRFQIDVESGDDEAFVAARDELVDGFAAWAPSSLPGSPEDAGVALDWKAHYADGDLVTWSIADLGEFALDWCPRKLSLPSRDCPAFLATVGQFFVYLASRGLLGVGGAGPEQLSSWCARHLDRFAAEMSDPANFGMAKGLFAGVGGLDNPPESPDEIEAMIQRVQRLDPEAFDDLVRDSLAPGPLDLPPVARPEPEDVETAAAEAPILAQMATLHASCADPGLALTQKGNLRLADARVLVGELGTGEDYATEVRSARELPELDWLMRVALRARVVRRRKGRLLAIGTWTKTGVREAFDRVADAAAVEGLLRPAREPASGEVAHNLDEETVQLLLVVAAGAGREIDVEGVAAEISEESYEPGSWVYDHHLGLVRQCLDRFERLGLIQQNGVSTERSGLSGTRHVGGRLRPTAAGVATALRWLDTVGLRFPELPDPASATAGELVDLVGSVGPETWQEIFAVWFSGHDGAVGALIGALRDEGRAPVDVLSVLSVLATAAGAAAPDVVRGLLGGRWDGIAATWLADHGDPGPLEQKPTRALVATVELLALELDGDGAEAMVAALPPDSIGPALNEMWRAEHPRVGDVLEVAGRHHPDKTIAKSARRSLAKWRSRSGAAR